MNAIDSIEASNVLLKSLRLQYHYYTLHYISIYYAEIDPVCVCTDCVYIQWVHVCVFILYTYVGCCIVYIAYLWSLSVMQGWVVLPDNIKTDNKYLFKLRPAGKTGVRKETWITDTADKAEVAISQANKPAQHHGSTVHGEQVGSFSFWTAGREEIPFFSTTESYIQIRRMPALIFRFSKHGNS